jgi:hypothetical protein
VVSLKYKNVKNQETDGLTSSIWNKRFVLLLAPAT